MVWSSDGSGGLPPPAGFLGPVLVVKLASGWRYDTEGSLFVADGGESVSHADDVPAGTEIAYMTPDLGAADPATLQEDERELARYLHFVLPRGTDLDRLRRRVARWECVAEARGAPTISLPGES